MHFFNLPYPLKELQGMIVDKDPKIQYINKKSYFSKIQLSRLSLKLINREKWEMTVNYYTDLDRF